MAFQTVGGDVYIPDVGYGRISALNNHLLDAANEELAAVLSAPKTGTIDKVGFLTGTVTTGATVDVRLETVSLTDGDPTGTLLGANSNGAQVIDAADDNTWFLTTLTTGVAVTAGDLFAATIVNPSGSPGNLNIRSAGGSDNRFPYTDFFTGSWAKVSGARSIFAFEYSDGSYVVTPGLYPFSTYLNVTFASNSTPDERGLKFQLPFPVRATGFWVRADLDAVADVVLYDSGDSALVTVSLDPDVRRTTSFGIFIQTFASLELTKDTTYRLVLKPTTTSTLRLQEFTVDAVAIMDSFGGGQNFHFTSRTNAGAWTDTTTRRPFMGLICDAFDDGVSVGGGGVRNPLGGPV